MSSIAGAASAVIGLIALYVVVGTQRGPSAVGGTLGAVGRGFEDLSSPEVPGVPDRADRKA